MNDPAELLAHGVSVAAALLRNRDGPLNRSLSVAVVGPKLTSTTSRGRNKRSQIFRFLEDAGHRPFYPERRIKIDQRWVLGEVNLLSSPEVDLVIVLQTRESWGVATEIGAFSGFPAIWSKTVILTPGEYYTPDSGFLANTVDLFPVKVRYTRRHFEECCLLEDCREIVEDFLASGSRLVRGLDL